MRKDDIPSALSNLAFDFFYWFSRFEFSLKENGYLKRPRIGGRASPGWSEFTLQWAESYIVSPEAHFLLTLRPETQVVGENGLSWIPTDLAKCASDLAKVTLTLKTIRNNLFHGGKHGGEGWDDAERTSMLLATGVVVLKQMADFAGLEADFTQYY